MFSNENATSLTKAFEFHFLLFVGVCRRTVSQPPVTCMGSRCTQAISRVWSCNREALSPQSSHLRPFNRYVAFCQKRALPPHMYMTCFFLLNESKQCISSADFILFCIFDLNDIFSFSLTSDFRSYILLFVHIMQRVSQIIFHYQLHNCVCD